MLNFALACPSPLTVLYHWRHSNITEITQSRMYGIFFCDLTNNSGVVKVGGGRGWPPPAETLPPSRPQWNYTLYRGLWRVAIQLSPSQLHCSFLSTPCRPSFWNVWLRPWRSIRSYSIESEPNMPYFVWKCFTYGNAQSLFLPLWPSLPEYRVQTTGWKCSTFLKYFWNFNFYCHILSQCANALE